MNLVFTIEPPGEAVDNLPMTAMKAILFGGDRLAVADEAVVLRVDGEKVGIATLAPKGEGTGNPTIVGVWIRRDHRRKGHGKVLFERAIDRALERGFQRVHVDLLSRWMTSIVNSISKERRGILSINASGMSMFDLMDRLD
jgi:GNAT superfamily N-acetyltransferase